MSDNKVFEVNPFDSEVRSNLIVLLLVWLSYCHFSGEICDYHLDVWLVRLKRGQYLINAVSVLKQLD